MDEVIVTSQAEYNALPADYKGCITVTGDARIEAGSSAAIINVCNLAIVAVHGSSTVIAYDSSKVIAYDSSKVIAHNTSFVRARDCSTVVSYESSYVEAYSHSTVRAYNMSTVRGFDSSTISSYDLSVVEANWSCAVSAYGSSQVVNFGHHKVMLSGQAREIAVPANIEEYSNWYNIPIIDNKIKLYKAVHKSANGDYYSNYDSHFCYSIGREYKVDCDEDIDKECSYGLHVSHLDWAINYGRGWADAAILEVEVPIECIMVPRGTDGKIRTSKLKVLREVPQEEWR